uniref:Uncharacterized protein n=1 Tax=Chlamydomonas euryale TaxID=1486919 RepID=A0A7R9VEA8_9CHLO|mmetsp:Transcript_31594/g.94195  ORF Transcript_31594/g.94195 Transcript_31594/m.94195 type:complete len:207 (+) Transcript_31594:189-809(+)
MLDGLVCCGGTTGKSQMCGSAPPWLPLSFLLRGVTGRAAEAPLPLLMRAATALDCVAPWLLLLRGRLPCAALGAFGLAGQLPLPSDAPNARRGDHSGACSVRATRVGVHSRGLLASAGTFQWHFDRRCGDEFHASRPDPARVPQPRLPCIDGLSGGAAAVAAAAAWGSPAPSRMPCARVAVLRGGCPQGASPAALSGRVVSARLLG